MFSGAVICTARAQNEPAIVEERAPREMVEDF